MPRTVAVNVSTQIYWGPGAGECSGGRWSGAGSGLNARPKSELPPLYEPSPLFNFQLSTFNSQL